MAFTAPDTDLLDAPKGFVAPADDEIVKPAFVAPDSDRISIKLDPSQQAYADTGLTDPQNESFDNYSARNPTASQLFAQKILPAVTTPDEQNLLTKYLQDVQAPELPVSSTAGQVWDALNSNTLTEARAQKEQQDTQRAANDNQMRQLMQQHGIDQSTIDATVPKPGIVSQVVGGVGNAAADLGTFFTTPMGIGTLGMGALPKVVQRGISLAFAAQMASQTPEIASQLQQEIAKPADQRDWEKISELVTSGLANTAFAGLGAAHGLSSEIAASEPPPQSEPANIKDSVAPGTAVPTGAAASTSKNSGFVAPADEIIQQEQNTPLPTVGTADASIVRTPDGAVDPVQTALNKLRAENANNRTSTESQQNQENMPLGQKPINADLPANPVENSALVNNSDDSPILVKPDALNQNVQSGENLNQPTIAARAAETPDKPVTMADLSDLASELKAAMTQNQIKPAENTVLPESDKIPANPEAMSIPSTTNEVTKNVPDQVENKVAIPQPNEPSQPIPAQSSGFNPPPLPEKFNSLDDALKYRQAYKDSEITFYKSLGLNDADAQKFFRAGDNRSNTDVSNLEKKLSPENQARLEKFSTGEGQPVYQWDRQYNPSNLAGETDKKTLSENVVGNLSRESAPNDLGDKMIHAAVSLRQLGENGGTWSDVARALDSHTTKISGSQGDKSFVFKKYGQQIRDFAKQQGIDLPQGELGAKIPESNAKKQIQEPLEESIGEKANALAAKLESLKSGIKGGAGGQLHAFGLASDLWDRAVSLAQAVIRKGGSIADAITAAIEHINANHKGTFDEQGARQQLNLATRDVERPDGTPTPERERSADEVKTDVDTAKTELEAATKKSVSEGGKENRQAMYQATAKYRSLRDELLHHPDYISEQLAKQHAAVTEANGILKPLDKKVGPEQFPNQDELRGKLSPEQFKRFQDLQQQIEDSHGELSKMPGKMVSRVHGEMQDSGKLPKSDPFMPNAGRTLQAMTDALKNSKSDSPKVSFADRFNIAKKAADTYTSGKDFVTKAWGNSIAASKALWSAFKAPPLTGDFKDVMKSWSGDDTRTSIENANYVKALVKKVPQKIRRDAISVWLDADGDQKLLEFQRQSVPEKYHGIWGAALKLTSYEKQKAQEIKSNFGQKLEDGVNVGVIGKGREDYGVPQRWKEAPQIDSDISDEKHGKPGNPYAKLDPRDPFFSFQRNTESYFDGIMAKGEPENLDIAHLVSVYDEAFHKALSSRGAIKALSDSKASDGQPIVKLSGKADIRTGDNPGVFVDSKSLPKDAVSADGRPYQSVDHWALRDWKFAAKDNSGNPILVRGDMLVHPDHVDFLKNELNTPRWTTKEAKGIEKIGRFALQASTYLKASKFIGPFHIVTEALHASFHGVVPSVKGFEINLNDPKQSLLSRNMMIDMGRAREMYDDGIRSAGGGIWKHVPGLGDAIVRMNNFTFNEYIPRLKMKVGLAVLERNLTRYKGKLTDDQIAEITGRQMDAAFGGQNWRLIGANKNTLAVARLAFVAPDFLISRAKVIGQSFKPYNQEQRVFLLAQAAGVYTLARILNSIFSDDHDPHFELRNWDSVVIGKRAYHARFIVSDAANLARDLLGLGDFQQNGIPFISGRLGVVPKTGIEALTGKDLFTGQNKDGLFHADSPALKAFSIMAGDMAEWMTPMGVDGFLPGAAKKGQTGLGSAVVATVGVSSKKENSTGQVWNMARQFNLNSKDPSTVRYQKQRDNETGGIGAYRALDNLLDAGNKPKAQEEYNALKADGRTAAQIAARYDRTLPFTGNTQREQQFVRSLTPEQKTIYQKARAEQKAHEAAFNALAK